MKPAPKFVLEILDILVENRYNACLVGGCVRDQLLGRQPSDWDIATSARPEDVLALFPRTVATGLRHGTVTVMSGGHSVEVTSFRSDGAYTDHRRPESVTFGCSLEADLARRDFTVNAMAMDAEGRLTDPFGGLEDLRRGLLRCVGEPELRFDEDALRMHRAVRLSAQLGFDIESNTMAALRRMAPLAARLSAERVRDELLKLLWTPRCSYVWKLVDLGLLGSFLSPGHASQRHDYAGLPAGSRLAHFCFDLEAGGYITSTNKLLSALRMDKVSVQATAAAVEILRSGSRDWKRLLRDHGEAPVVMAYPNDADLQRVLRSNECWKLSDLAIGGRELLALGYTGPELGKALEELLEHVIDNPDDNDADILCRLANRKVLN